MAAKKPTFVGQQGTGQGASIRGYSNKNTPDRSKTKSVFAGKLATINPLLNVTSKVSLKGNDSQLVTTIADMSTNEAISLLSEQVALLKTSFRTSVRGPAGSSGIAGTPGTSPAHEWDEENNLVRFQNADGTWGPRNTFARGPIGDQGEKGDTGNIGPQGPVGLQGTQGIQGSQGIAGPQGPQGLQGDTGDRPSHLWDGNSLRFQNPDGSWGVYTDLTGPQGEVGPRGPQGPALTIEGGSFGLHYEWDGTSLRIMNEVGVWGDWVDLGGSRGLQGEQGLTGASGSAGPQGLQGEQGLTGASGSAGPQGLQGEQGLTGASGSAGPQGLQGEQGIQGLTGASGSTGLAAAHEWSGTEIRFQNPDGSWGDYTDLALSGTVDANSILGTFDAIDLRAANGERYRLEATNDGDLTFATASNLIEGETYLVTDEVKLRADNGNIYTLSATDSGSLVFYTGSL